MDKSTFLNQMNEYIASALSEMGEGNTIDLRANRYPYDVRNDYCVYSIIEVEDAWDFVKDAEEWYVDIYENMNSEGRAEYADYAVTSWDSN